MKSQRIHFDETELIGGDRYYYKSLPFTGVVFQTFKDGTVSFEDECIDGYFIGWSKSYFPNGNLEQVEDKLGNIFSWNPDGSFQSSNFELVFSGLPILFWSLKKQDDGFFRESVLVFDSREKRKKGIAVEVSNSHQKVLEAGELKVALSDVSLDESRKSKFLAVEDMGISRQVSFSDNGSIKYQRINFESKFPFESYIEVVFGMNEKLKEVSVMLFGIPFYLQIWDKSLKIIQEIGFEGMKKLVGKGQLRLNKFLEWKKAGEPPIEKLSREYETFTFEEVKAELKKSGFSGDL